jgi:hypothetical protein
MKKRTRTRRISANRELIVVAQNQESRLARN